MRATDLLERARRVPAPVIDVLVVAVVAFPTVMDAWWNEAGSRQADGATYGLAVVSVLALFGRHRWPIGTALLTGAALTGLYVLGHHGELLNLPVMVALYTVAVAGDRRTTLVVGVVASAWCGLLAFTSDDPIGARGGSPVLEMLIPLVPLALGDAVRSRREVVAYAEAEQERKAQRRIEAERTRMAREFHDVVAHTMAAVNVQMAAAVAAFDNEPEIARRALHQARASSKVALQELRATVALARGGDVAPPAPRLDEIPELTALAAAAGIEVTLRDERNGAALSGAAEVAAFRVVQEALTNVVRHSNARHVDISLQLTADGLLLEVIDDGTTTSPVSSGGFGLTGMAERVRAVGGQLEHGPMEGGGFRIEARVPIAEPTA